jgi:hypothetical protein
MFLSCDYFAFYYYKLYQAELKTSLIISIISSCISVCIDAFALLYFLKSLFFKDEFSCEKFFASSPPLQLL